MVTSCVLNNILRYEGMASLAMIGLTTGGILNIILDPILIFKFNLDISGAGIATAFSQYVSLVIPISAFLMKKPQSRLSLKYFSFKPKYTLDIIATGVPSFARQGLNSVSTMFMNIQAAAYGGDECIAAMSIVGKVGMLIFSVCVGIGQGFQPVCSFNYGAGIFKRVNKGITFVWKFGTIVVTALAAFCFAFAPQIVMIFRKDTAVVEIGSEALRILCVALVFLPTVMTANMTFQSVGKSAKAFFISCLQNGLFFIPLVLVLPRFIDILGIEVSHPIAYTISAIVSVPILLAFMNELKNKSAEV